MGREETPTRLHAPSPESRILGCLLGGAVGDALGAPVEFLSLAEIRHQFGPEGVREYEPAYGRMGAITDDTQMTLFTAEGLLRADVRYCRRGICDPPSIVQHAYLRWLATQGEKLNATIAREEGWPDGWLVGVKELWSRRAPGNTCLAALKGTKKLGDKPSNNSKGCGTVMRVAPVGLVCSSASEGAWSAFDLGMKVSRLTHGHPSGYLAGGFFAALVACILDGLPLRDAVAAAVRPLDGREDGGEVREAVEAAVRLAEAGEPSPERVESLGKGWTAEEAVAIDADEVVTAMAKTIAELTSSQTGEARQGMIEQLTREIMDFDAQFRREDAMGTAGSEARH